MSVFIAVDKTDGTKEVLPARNYQIDAYNDLMKKKRRLSKKSKTYSYNDGEIVFTLTKLENPTEEENSFCYLVNDKNERHILSDNEVSLSDFVRKYNRHVNGGSYKKTSTKRKPRTKKPSTKRKPRTKKTSTKRKKHKYSKKKGYHRKR